MYTQTNELDQLADKIEVKGVRGTVNKVFPPKGAGPINVILGMIGGEYKLAFWPNDWDQNSVSALNGKTIEVTGNLSKGVRNHKGNTYHSVNVHKGAEIAFVEGGGSQDTNQGEKTPSASTHTGSAKPLQAKLEIQKMSNLHCACFVAATHQRENLAHAGHKMTEEMFQATVSSLFIQASRENLHKLMPDSPITLKPVEKAEPKPETETTFYDE